MAADPEDARRLAQQLAEHNAHLDQIRREAAERDRWDYEHGYDDDPMPENRWTRAAQARARRSDRAARRQEDRYRCQWSGCADTNAHFERYNFSTDTVVLNEVYRESPFCTKHLYEAWRIAQDAVDGAALERHRRNVVAALHVNEEADPALTEQRPLQPTSKITGSIYYLHFDGIIKIGYASNLYARMRSYAPTARLAAVRPGNLYEEQREHQLLREHRAYRREWYRPTEVVLARINQVLAQYGPLPEADETPLRRSAPVRLRARTTKRLR